MSVVEVKLSVLLTSCNSQRSRDSQATPPTSSFAVAVPYPIYDSMKIDYRSAKVNFDSIFTAV